MAVDAALELPRAAVGTDLTDAITVSFGDPVRELYATFRLGLAGGTASGLAIIFREQELALLSAEGVPDVAHPADWHELTAAGIRITTREPLRAWSLELDYEGTRARLELEATGAPYELPPASELARAGGMLGYEQPIRVRGTIELDGRTFEVDALGQRGHAWGSVDWTRIERTRTVSAWFGDAAISLSAILPAGRDGHGQEACGAVLFERSGDEPALQPVAFEDPRISTTYDEDGRQQRAALELWLDEEGPPTRAWGEILCGTTLDLGRLRLDCSFMHWHAGDRAGVGRYDILRRAT